MTLTYQALQAFAGLTTAAAGLALGLSWIIVTAYWHVYRRVRNGARLLPLHVMLIGTSYSMLAFIGVLRLGSPPPPGQHDSWWIYPFITLAFAIGDLALVLILLFIRRRGTGVEKNPHSKGNLRRRASDGRLA